MITTNKDRVKRFLEIEPKAREWTNKNLAISHLLLDKFDGIARLKDRRQRRKAFAELILEANNMDRCWRKVVEENPDLRGSDYNDKKILEQQAQIDLGYGQ